MSDSVVAWMWYVGYCCIWNAACRLLLYLGCSMSGIIVSRMQHVRYYCIWDAAYRLILYPGCGMSDIILSGMQRLLINQGLVIAHRQWKHTQKTEHML